MRFLPAFFIRNWKLKLAALVLAILLWTSLRLEAMDRQSLPSVPVRVQLNDPQWAVQDEPEPATVEVEFTGPARELFALYLDRPTVMVPVDVVSAADTSVLVRPEWVRLPSRPGVAVEEIRPSSVRLFFEPIEQAVVPLRLRTEGSLPEELALAEPLSMSPDFTRVSGPRSRLEALDSISLQPLDLSEIRVSGGRRVRVDTAGLSSVVISPGATEVSVIVEDRIQRTVSGVPVVPPRAAQEVELEPDTVSVRLTGARSLVEGVDPGVLRAEPSTMALELLEAGDSQTVRIELLGVPDMVRAEPLRDTVTASRPGPATP